MKHLPKDRLYLCQTDTTAGFCSQNLGAINQAKERPLEQPCLITVSKFANLLEFTRIPNHFKNRIRRAKKTTFIYPNSRALRVVKDCAHVEFLDEMSWVYSSSANSHGDKFDLEFAMSRADVVVDDSFWEEKSSKIQHLNQIKIKKIR